VAACVSVTRKAMYNDVFLLIVSTKK